MNDDNEIGDRPDVPEERPDVEPGSDPMPNDSTASDSVANEEFDFSTPYFVHQNEDGLLLNYQLTSEYECMLLPAEWYKDFTVCVDVPAEITIGGRTLTVTKLADYTFRDCTYLPLIHLPRTIATIGEHIFDNCKALKAIDVDADNTYYYSHEGVLYKTALHSLIKYPQNKGGDYVITEGTTRIRLRAFEKSGLTSVVIPSSVTKMAASAFEQCGELQSVEIGDGLQSIEDWAFAYCGKLQRLVIGEGMRQISFRVFESCGSLSEVHVRAAAPPTCTSTSFDYRGMPSTTLYVPQGTRQAYEQAEVWNTFGSIVEE